MGIKNNVTGNSEATQMWPKSAGDQCISQEIRILHHDGVRFDALKEKMGNATLQNKSF